jgi:heme/copper-type cytochrome/quinol oxidase subunit 2
MRLSSQEGAVVTRIRRFAPRPVLLVVALASAASVAASIVLVAQAKREFTVVARRYEFTVSGSETPTIRVRQNDLVRIRFLTEDIPHSFTIEEAPYRIMRRAEPGKPVTFNFRADAPGRFRFYCNLTAEEGCRDMQGTLIVEPAR